MIQDDNIERLEDAAAKWCKENNWYHAYVTAKNYGNSMFIAGTKWQAEQYKDLIQSHAELLICLEACISYLKEECTINAAANKAIEKANSIINQQK